MAINLMNIKPHVVSRSMRGYIVFFFGEAKSGKTTTACKFPKHLLLAFEKGYNAIPGAMAQPINSWAEFRQVLRELKKEDAKGAYETVIVDTADIAYDYCEKYICANAKRSDGTFGVDSIADIGYGKGYGLVAKEFDEGLRSIVQMGYGLVLISHSEDKTFTDEAGATYNQIVPTLGNKARNIVCRMADIVGYARGVQDEDGHTATRLFMRGTPRFMAGSRFKFTPDSILFTYDNLVNAISEAIDKQEKNEGTQFFSNDASNLYTASELDFDTLMTSINATIQKIISTHSAEEVTTYWQPRIVQITDKYLGRGNKISQCSREQVEALSLILDELEALIKQ